MTDGIFWKKKKKKTQKLKHGQLKIISQLSLIAYRNFVKGKSSTEYVMCSSKAGNYY